MTNEKNRSDIVSLIQFELKEGPIKDYIVYCVDDNDIIKKSSISVYQDMLKFVQYNMKVNKLTYAIVSGCNPPSVTIVQYDKAGLFESFYYDVVDGFLILNEKMSEMQNASAVKSLEEKYKRFKKIGKIFPGIWFN